MPLPKNGIELIFNATSQKSPTFNLSKKKKREERKKENVHYLSFLPKSDFVMFFILINGIIILPDVQA